MSIHVLEWITARFGPEAFGAIKWAGGHELGKHGMSTSNAECIYSTLAADPDLGELTTMFAEETPDRIATILEQLERQDWAALRRTAHQIKGAAGGYGFDALTMPAAVLEHNCPGDPETIAQLAGELVGLMRRVRAGVPEESSR